MQRGSEPGHVKSKKSRRGRKSADGAVCAQNADVRCWNSQHGCTFTGDSTLLLQHLEQDCPFHEITCAVCHVPVLLMDISKHLRQDCSKSAEAYSGIAAASVSAESTSRPLSTATVSPGDSPLTVGDVDRAFVELKEMFSALTAHQVSVVETRVNELSENIASLEAKLVDVDAREQPDSVRLFTRGCSPDSVMAKMGDLLKEIVTLRTAVFKSMDTAAKKTEKLQEQVRRCAEKEQLNGLDWKVNELQEQLRRCAEKKQLNELEWEVNELGAIVSRNNADLMQSTEDIKDRCDTLAQESTVRYLRSQLQGLIADFLSFESKLYLRITFILAILCSVPAGVARIIIAGCIAITFMKKRRRN